MNNPNPNNGPPGPPENTGPFGFGPTWPGNMPFPIYVAQGQQPRPKGKAFVASTAAVVLTGVLGFGVINYTIRKPPEKVIVPAPAPPAPPPIIVREWAPSPAVLPPVQARIESRPEPTRPPDRQRPPDPPPPAPVGRFDGAWLVVGRPLPAFTLRDTGSATKGTYAPANVTGQYAFTAGPVINGAIEFSCTDQLGQRVFFAMKFESSTEAKVWMWRLAEDVLADMTRVAHRRDLTPQQRQVMQIALQRELKLAGKRLSIGKFRRAKDGSEDAS